MHGTTLAVSSPQAQLFGPGGSKFVRKKHSTNLWDLSQTFWSDSNQSDEHFGNDLALNSEYLLIGSPKEDDGSNGVDSVAAYLFEKNSTTHLWSSVVTRFSPSSLSPNDEFHSDALWDNYAFIGAKNGGIATIPVWFMFLKKKPVRGMKNKKSILQREWTCKTFPRPDYLRWIVGISSPGAGEDGMIYLYEKKTTRVPGI